VLLAPGADPAANSLAREGTIKSTTKKIRCLKFKQRIFYTAMNNQNPRSTRDALRHHDPR